MFSMVPKPPISRRQKRLALMVAGFVDFLQVAVFPLFFEGGMSPFDDALDIFAALALTFICGFKWQFVLAFSMELIPFLDILPTWTAVVLLLPAHDDLQEMQRIKVSISAPQPPETIPSTKPKLIDVQAEPVSQK